MWKCVSRVRGAGVCAGKICKQKLIFFIKKQWKFLTKDNKIMKVTLRGHTIIWTRVNYSIYRRQFSLPRGI